MQAKTEEVGRIVVRAWIGAKTEIQSMTERNVGVVMNDGQGKIVVSTAANLAALHLI